MARSAMAALSLRDFRAGRRAISATLIAEAFQTVRYPILPSIEAGGARTTAKTAHGMAHDCASRGPKRVFCQSCERPGSR